MSKLTSELQLQILSTEFSAEAGNIRFKCDNHQVMVEAFAEAGEFDNSKVESLSASAEALHTNPLQWEGWAGGILAGSQIATKEWD